MHEKYFWWRYTALETLEGEEKILENDHQNEKAERPASVLF